ncbi:MAG: OmpA family protein [Bacteroidota bacterium]
MRLIVGIAAFLLWSLGSGYWYACQVKGACGPDTSVTSGADSSRDDPNPASDPPRRSIEKGDRSELESSAIPEDSGKGAEIFPDNVSPDTVVSPATPPVLPTTLPTTLRGKRTVRFSFAKPLINDRADLTDYIEAAAEFLRQHSQSRIRIVGYTDDTAARENNLKLGLRRAEAVADLFRAESVPEEQLDLRTEGEANPVASNDTRAGRQQNRRAELQLILNFEN